MKSLTALLLLTGLAGAAQAADYSAVFGKDFQHFSRTPQGAGIGLTLDYVNHDHHGNAGGAGLEFAFPLGGLTLAAGGKVMGLNPDTGSASAILAGGRANLALTSSIGLYGQAYYSTHGMVSGSVNNVSDLAAGVRWSPITPFMVEAGWRRFDIQRDGGRDARLSDGPYLGFGLSF